jgi:CRP/FNR family transcriptional regulator, cyclic AMP receptor protein
MQEMGSGQVFWDLLTPDEQHALSSLGHDRKYQPGATVCGEGDPATHVFVLLDGWVKVLSVTENGHENVLALRGGGDLVGETSGETSGQRNATVQALGAVRALIVSRDRFSSFLDDRPGADRAYRRLITQRWRDADAMLRRRMVTSGAQRLAGLLLDLARRHDTRADVGIELALPLSQEELASLAGTSRATVARALSTWRKDGLIRTRQRRIILIDLLGLQRAAGPAVSL